MIDLWMTNSCPVRKEQWTTPSESFVLETVEHRADAIEFELRVFSAEVKLLIPNGEAVKANGVEGVDPRDATCAGVIQDEWQLVGVEPNTGGYRCAFDLDRQVLGSDDGGVRIECGARKWDAPLSRGNENLDGHPRPFSCPASSQPVLCLGLVL